MISRGPATFVQRLHDVSAGLKSADGDGSLTEQLALYAKKEQEAATTIKQETMKLKHLAGVKSQADQDLKKAHKEQSSMSGQLDEMQKEVETLQEEVQKLKKGYSPEKEASGFSLLEGLRTKYKSALDQRRGLEAQISSRFNFEYTDPSTGFDRSKVKGRCFKNKMRNL